MLDAIIDLRTPRILLILRNAFGGAYAAFNSYATGADVVLALPTTRVAVMGTAGKEYVYKTELQPDARRRGREEARKAGDARSGEVAEWLKARGGEAQPALRARAHEPARGALAGLDLRDRHADRPPPRARRSTRASCCATTSPARWSSRSASSTDGDPRPSDRSGARPRSPPGGVARLVRRERLPVGDRRLGESRSAWVRSFACDDMRC